VEKIPLLVWYSPVNKYSLNAILGALEKSSYQENLEFLLFTRSEKLISEVKNRKRALLLASVMTKEAEEKKNFLLHLKDLNSHLEICLGGPHITAKGEEFFSLNPWLVKKEGEEAIEKVIEGFIANSSPSLITFPHPVDLDSFPPFPRSLGIFGPIEITRGCPFGCYFCQTAYLSGRQVRHRSIEMILEYVSLMKRKDLTDIRFITPNALSYGSPDGKTINLKALQELLTRVRKIIGPQGRIFFGSFPSEIRPEFVTPETIKLLRSLVNNDNLVIGAQSGSEKMLQRMKRGHTKEEIFKAAEIAIQENFRVNIDFIFGLPGETEEDQKETLSTIETLTKMGAIIHAHYFTPLPGTPWEREKPSPLGSFLRKRLGKLAQEGKLFGNYDSCSQWGEKRK